MESVFVWVILHSPSAIHREHNSVYRCLCYNSQLIVVWEFQIFNCRVKDLVCTQDVIVGLCVVEKTSDLDVYGLHCSMSTVMDFVHFAHRNKNVKK